MVRAKVSEKKPLPCIVFCRFLSPRALSGCSIRAICSCLCCPAEQFLQLFCKAKYSSQPC